MGHWLTSSFQNYRSKSVRYSPSEEGYQTNHSTKKIGRQRKVDSWTVHGPTLYPRHLEYGSLHETASNKVQHAHNKCHSQNGRSFPWMSP